METVTGSWLSQLRAQLETKSTRLFARFRSYCSWHALNPLNWSTRTIKVVTATFFTIMLPIYLFIGFMPAPPADAINYPVLSIPSINLDTPVAAVELVDHQLVAPATIAGVYHAAPHKLFLLGHSTTVFQNLHRARLDDQITYDGQTYQITNIITLRKADIDMRALLSVEASDTIVIMTCAGELLDNQDATHRLIVTARAI